MSAIIAQGRFDAVAVGEQIFREAAFANQAHPAHTANGRSMDRYRQDSNTRMFTKLLGEVPARQRASLLAGYRQDAHAGGTGGGLFLARQLDQVLDQVLREPLPELSGLTAFGVSRKVKPGARTYTARRLYEAGSATIYRGGNQPIPRSTLRQREEQRPVRHLVSAFEWSLFEGQSADFGNFSLVTEGVQTANNAIAQLLNSLIWNGSTVDGIWGILNYPWLDKKVSADTFTPASDPIDVKAWVMSLLNYPQTQSKEVFVPTDVIMGGNLFRLLNDMPMSVTNGSNISVLRYIAENNSQRIPLANFKSCWELNDAGGTGIDGILVYRKDAQGVQVQMVQDTTSIPLQMQGFQTTQYLYSSYGGVTIFDVGGAVLGFAPVSE
tara:strand:- start:990 stop:2132 length:1143 start_codon:yes stop_codon:yes gene_type:complete